MRDTAYQALQVKERLTAEKNREPDTDEIAREMGVDRQEVYFALDAITEPVSIYEPIFSDGGESLCVMDQIGDRHNTDNSWIEQLTLSEAMKSLGLREKKILALRFFEGKTQMEVAQDVGISQAQVSRLEKNALGHIKKYIGVE
jgi:RNA polymerase sporulation-specific sigma factor